MPNSVSRSNLQKWGLGLGAILFLILAVFLTFGAEFPRAGKMAAVAVLMAAWWITDAIPLFATALLPLIFFPAFGILKADDIAHLYINSTIFLFIGGFMIALTMEKWSLHKRIALTIIRFIGGSADRIILGFMAAAAFLSMWISNTATAVMMMPIGLAIIVQMEDQFSAGTTRQFSTGLMLGIAYACSVGGIATLVGTPPNLAFTRIFQITFPGAEPIAFGTWLLMGLPLAVIMLVIIWFMITKLFYRIPQSIHADTNIVESEYASLGPIQFEERVVLIVFMLTALLWIFRRPLTLGSFTIPGWSQLIPYPKLVDDGTVAIFMAAILFFIPSRSPRAKTATIMGADVVRRLPWNIVLLFGGGFALAKGMQASGLSEIIGNHLMGFQHIHPLIIIMIICLSITFLTELTSNTATTQMILPILASVAIAMHLNPLILMIPATLAASQAFMMPVATPPNAIVFGSERVEIRDMAKIGFFINLIGVLVITLVFYYLGQQVFGFDPTQFPDWANHTAGIHP